MAKVEFRNVTKIFDRQARTLAEVSLTVEDGEFVVIVGPSGCGKSTLLRILAGLETATAGEVVIGGAVVNDWSPQRRNVAMVFQDYALYPHMTVRRNLEFPLRIRGMAKAEMRARVEQVAELLALGALLDRRPRELSGGQRQRVAMGRAVVREPSVFLMDEPLSNLDPKLRAQIRTEIAPLQQRLGTTTLYVTHDQVEAMTLGQRIAVLDAGRLQQVGRPQDLYERPATAFVAMFLGSPGMNVVSATLQQDAAGRPTLFGGRWRLPRELTLPPGAAVRVGVRPEALRPAAGGDDLLPLPVDIAAVERLGHEQLVYGRLAGTPEAEDTDARAVLRSDESAPGSIVARLPAGQPASAGDRLLLGVRPQEVHLFEAGGAAICHSLPGAEPARDPRIRPLAAG